MTLDTWVNFEMPRLLPHDGATSQTDAQRFIYNLQSAFKWRAAVILVLVMSMY